jgi:hypothetical protein
MSGHPQKLLVVSVRGPEHAKHLCDRPSKDFDITSVEAGDIYSICLIWANAKVHGVTEIRGGDDQPIDFNEDFTLRTACWSSASNVLMASSFEHEILGRH